jgi:hypothetical protein
MNNNDSISQVHPNSALPSIPAQPADDVAPLAHFLTTSIRDHRDFRADVERLSWKQISKDDARLTRKAIYDTVDERVRNAIRAAQAEHPVSVDGRTITVRAPAAAGALEVSVKHLRTGGTIDLTQAPPAGLITPGVQALMAELEANAEQPGMAGAAVPEGWQLVPIKPTHQMLPYTHGGIKSYAAMLAAAPIPPLTAPAPQTVPNIDAWRVNVAGQCRATATSDIAANVLVDGGSGTLRELLTDAAAAIEAAPAPQQSAEAPAAPDTSVASVAQSIDTPEFGMLLRDFANYENLTVGYGDVVRYIDAHCARQSQPARASAEQVRDAALEEAAQVCDALERAKWESTVNVLTNGGRIEFAGPMKCAAHIRALRQQASNSQEPASGTAANQGEQHD